MRYVISSEYQACMDVDAKGYMDAERYFDDLDEMVLKTINDGTPAMADTRDGTSEVYVNGDGRYEIASDYVAYLYVNTDNEEDAWNALDDLDQMIAGALRFSPVVIEPLDGTFDVREDEGL